MKHVCAWCLRELSPAAAEAGPISHGICRPCADRFLGDRPIPLDRFPGDRPIPLELFLDDLPVPVMVLDGESVIGFANRQAQLLLNRSAEQIAGSRGGDVFLCANAGAAEGCGHTANCAGCAIRACVLKTHLTGEPQVMVPAALKTAHGDSPMPVALTITTVKRGASVLLVVNGCDEAEAEAEPHFG